MECNQLVQGQLFFSGLRSLSQVGGFDGLGGNMLVIQVQLLVMADQFGPHFFQ